MRNLADAIENFIIRQLLEDSEDTVLVQRNEIIVRSVADKLCYKHALYAGKGLSGGIAPWQRRLCAHCAGYAAQ